MTEFHLRLIYISHATSHLHVTITYISLVSPVIVNSDAGSCSLRFLSTSITNIYVFFTLICIPHQAVNSCTTFSSFCMPSGVSAKIEISSMNPMLLNWWPFSSRWLSPFWSLPICSQWLISSFCPATVSMRSRTLMKMMKSCGDLMLPCATPVARTPSWGCGLYKENGHVRDMA